MYGGVATPLALLHGEMNGRTKQHNPMQNRSNSRDDSYNNSVRNPIRLPPLRETGQRDHNTGCENEPLLPSALPQKLTVKPKRNVHEEPPLLAPPLPPHKNNNYTQEMRYVPPWPRAPNPYCVINPEQVKPYLKPLPKPPGKESPNRQNRRHISPGPMRTVDQTPEFLRNKLQTRQNRNSPLHARRSPHQNRHSPLQRHYSDESLGGVYATGAPQRIHSSADEISSLNHSPSISSSDESYSRTTDADASPCVSPPLPADAQQFLFPSDIQVNPCSSPEVSPRASLDYIPPNCSLRNNSSDRANVKRNNLPPNAILALAATCNTVDSSIITSPPVLDGEDSCRGESCASFEFVCKPKQKVNNLLRTCSANGVVAKQRSLEKPTRNDSDSIIECNKVSAVCKRSPSFKEAEEINELLKTDDSARTKRDGCCQTDKKDIRKLRMSPSGLREKLSPNLKLNNTDQTLENITGPFEREIQKLLDEQNLLQNIPPKTELLQQNKDLSLEPLVRYAPNNNNHQVGLAAIQALALGLRVNPAAGSVTLQCMSPPRASSKEGSLKRGASPGPSECHKQQKISPLDRYRIVEYILTRERERERGIINVVSACSYSFS